MAFVAFTLERERPLAPKNIRGHFLAPSCDTTTLRALIPRLNFEQHD